MRSVDVNYKVSSVAAGSVNGQGEPQPSAGSEPAARGLRQQRDALIRRISEHADALQLLYEVASATNRADSLDEALQFALKRLCQYNGWSFGHVYLPVADNEKHLHLGDVCYEETPGRFQRFRDATLKTPVRPGEGIVGRVYQSGKPQWVTNLGSKLAGHRPEAACALGVQTAAAFPVLVGTEVVAVMEVFSDREIDRGESALEMMASIGLQLGRVAERKKLEKQIADRAAREQRLIGYELHDSVAQHLTGIGLLAEDLRQQLRAGAPPLERIAASLVEYVQETQRQVRRLSRGLMPVEVDANGLMAALEELVDGSQELSGIRCTFECDRPVPLKNNTMATHLYRIAQEAVQNAIRHAEASHVVISLASDTSRIILTVCDNGRGIADYEQNVSGMGFRIMRYRAGVVGAKLSIHSTPEEGTAISCRLPNIGHTEDD